MVDDVCIDIHRCDQCTRFKQPQERTGMQPILVSYPLELIHLDFLLKEEKQITIEVLIFWLSQIISPSMPKHM